MPRLVFHFSICLSSKGSDIWKDVQAISRFARRAAAGPDYFFSSPVASWVRYALIKPSMSPHPTRRGRAGAPHRTQMVGQSPPISRFCPAKCLDAALRRNMDGEGRPYFFSSPVASWVRYALIKPSMSPSMTLSMLPVS